MALLKHHLKPPCISPFSLLKARPRAKLSPQLEADEAP
ncbi:hypothetical protein HHE02_11830 [Helicobacter heilmannii]|uniref:Uncharacterized protein n=1 Tax=Helicobacter heilmannii TaxID=35817 RepID=A0A0K2XHU3_HELHE|nr:hypothetical protein HHE014_10480 [Helicobacter heilmannii]CRF47883.1 hypothetical protein HHE02_11830 [Helicobacter heilmannii]CRF51580.1 hypothetical protein HHE06_14680 [Helicobacter heilmannii]CRI33624.1 hypothetical protein HHE01_08280 [Helicobacter heilmannii]